MKKDSKHSTITVRESRAEALIKIKALLDVGNIDSKFDYWSENETIVSFLGNRFGLPSTFAIKKSNKAYLLKTGCAAQYIVSNQLKDTQITAYTSIEHALIDVGLKLCVNGENGEFYIKYGAPYNERLKKDKK